MGHGASFGPGASLGPAGPIPGACVSPGASLSPTGPNTVASLSPEVVVIPDDLEETDDAFAAPDSDGRAGESSLGGAVEGQARARPSLWSRRFRDSTGVINLDGQVRKTRVAIEAARAALDAAVHVEAVCTQPVPLYVADELVGQGASSTGMHRAWRRFRKRRKQERTEGDEVQD